MISDELRVYLRAEGTLARRFYQIKNRLGVKNDTEVLRMLINWYWMEHEDELQPRFKHFNLNQDGVVVLDVENDRLIQIYFRPEGVYCESCESHDCPHIRFALSLPKVQEILRKKGWKTRAGGEQAEP